VSRRVTSVAVVGRDVSLWLTVVALQSALGRTGLRIHAVDLGSRLSRADVYVALPTLASLHRLLGVDERLVLDACRGVPMVGQRFSNWAKGAPPFMLAYDDEPPPGGRLPFLQYWAKAALEGLRVGLEEFSLGSGCARLNAVPLPVDENAVLSASYGYQLEAQAYAELLKQLALRRGIEIAASPLCGVGITGDTIEGVELADGTRIEADLYVDASGREARLIGGLASAHFESWSEWLPCDRLLAASAPRMPSLPAFSQVSAFHGGWVGLFPLQDRTAVVAAYSSTAAKDSEVADLAGVITRVRISGDAVVSDLGPGARQSPWLGNCVAIGEAAIAPDPIDGVEMQVTQAGISHLVSLFPATAGKSPEASAYNAAIRSFGSNLRDFQAAHYLFNRRYDEAMWDRVRDAAPPPGLARKAGMFRARAIIPMADEETFQEQGWAALLTGCGIVPQGYDPRVDVLPAEAHVEMVQQRLRAVAELARRMPAVDQFIAAEQQMPLQAGA